MKNFSFKLLQQLNQKKADKGFTLIELLVVIIIIGILSAIALPAFLNQANKARQSEAKQALGSINRGQQAYYLERQLFSDTIDGLGLGLALSTENYSYGGGSSPADKTTFSGQTYGGGTNGTTTAVAQGTKATRQGFTGWNSYAAAYAVAANQNSVRDYVAVAYIVPATTALESTTKALLCEELDLKGTTMSYTHSKFISVTQDTDVQCGGANAFANNAQNVGQ